SLAVELHHAAIAIAIGDIDFAGRSKGDIRRPVKLIRSGSGTSFRAQRKEQLSRLIEFPYQVPLSIRDPDKIIFVDANPVSALHVSRATADQSRSPRAPKLSCCVEAEDRRGLALYDIDVSVAINIDSTARSQRHAFRQ